MLIFIFADGLGALTRHAVVWILASGSVSMRIFMERVLVKLLSWKVRRLNRPRMFYKKN